MNSQDVLEARIAHQLGSNADHEDWFSSSIPPDDFQLAEVVSWLSVKPGRCILDVGCARGRFARHLAELGADVVGIDVTPQLISDAHSNVPAAEFVLASGSRIPFADCTFDGLLCIEVLEHIPNTRGALQDMVRVLRPGGRIVIIDKNKLSLEPDFLTPTLLRKRVLEMVNQWVYPREFPFRERYFTFWEVERYLRELCETTDSHFLPDFRMGPKSEAWLKRFPWLRWIKRDIVLAVYRSLPFLSFYILWRGIK